ncbi:MAG: hypothetical protein R3C08_02020 [Hyphomonas sp.]
MPGLGRTGSAAKALKAGGARVHAWDDNEETRKSAEAAGPFLSDINKRDWQTLPRSSCRRAFSSSRSRTGSCGWPR